MGVTNIIIIVVLILVLLWILNRWFFRTNIIYDLMCDANKESSDSDSDTTLFSTKRNIVYNKDMNENNTANFMLSVWFYIDNWGNNISNEKNILYISSTEQSRTHSDLQDSLIGISKNVDIGNETILTTHPYKNLNIALDKHDNNLIIDIETYDNSPRLDTQTVGKTITRYIIKNIPIQKWNNLTLSVDTKTLDVYLDGKLRNSFILHGVYRSHLEDNNKKNIYIGNLGTFTIDSSTSTSTPINNNGFEGFITRIRYEPNSINPQDAHNIYRAGISASLAKSIYNKYSLKVSFLEYNKERGSFQI